VAAAGMKLWGWWLAAVLAAGLLGFLAFHGKRPEAGLARFEPAGLLVGWSLENLETIELSAGTEHRFFRRVGSDGWRGDGGSLPASAQERVATGLKLLHNSAPERVFGAGELDERMLGEFGLAPPRLAVTVTSSSGRSITIHFGGANPLGLARYSRIEGRPEVVLLPGFVAEAWEQAMGAR